MSYSFSIIHQIYINTLHVCFFFFFFSFIFIFMLLQNSKVCLVGKYLKYFASLGFLSSIFDFFFHFFFLRLTILCLFFPFVTEAQVSPVGEYLLWNIQYLSHHVLSFKKMMFCYLTIFYQPFTMYLSLVISSIKSFILIMFLGL